jgi:hypothetical protein
MADYQIPEYVTKRLRYFNNQFLQEQDFIDEQHYHIDRQQRHNRLLHSPGVAEGLDIKKVGDIQIQVDPGTAIDGQGRQILLPTSRPVDVKDKNGNLFQQGQLVYLVIFYSQQESNEASTAGQGKTRWEESPGIECYEQNNVPADDNIFLRLAQLTIGEGGRVDEIKTDIRKLAGGKTALPADSIDENQLKQVVRAKLVNMGNNHDHTNGNGSQLKHSSLNKDDGFNPHNTKIEHVSDGIMKIKQPDNPNGVSVSNRLYVTANVPGVYNPPNDERMTNKGSVFILNTSDKSYGLVAKVSETADVPPRDKTPIPPAAVVAIAGRNQVYGIYTTALSDNHALYVQGKATIADSLIPGHIGDTFVNGSGQRLKTGDVVKLKGTPITRYRGVQNKIPIAEVTLANKEDDTSVIGIVDSEAIPEPGKLDTRVNPEDSSLIEDGGELYVVTLGVFAHCKVDANFAPIEVGDLLTTSNHPGYAKKATQPKLGSIIGKALESLKEGTGEISVFVNIQ